MISVKGNKQITLSEEQFGELAKRFDEVVVDLGTGDGRYVYKSADAEPNKLFIGIDTLPKTMEEYSKKARKNKLENALFTVGSLENLPKELLNKADRVLVILPWGSLLKNIAVPTDSGVSALASLVKPEGNLEIVLGYSIELEPSETARLGLPEKIDSGLIEGEISYAFKHFGNFDLVEYHPIISKELAEIESTWCKKITFGKEREFFRILFKRG